MEPMSQPSAPNKRTLKDKAREFMKIPDIGEIQRMMDGRFRELVAKLDEILVELRKMNERQAGQ